LIGFVFNEVIRFTIWVINKTNSSNAPFVRVEYAAKILNPNSKLSKVNETNFFSERINLSIINTDIVEKNRKGISERILSCAWMITGLNAKKASITSLLTKLSLPAKSRKMQTRNSKYIRMLMDFKASKFIPNKSPVKSGSEIPMDN